MTVIEAIKEVLKDKPNGMFYTDIYNEIIRKNLYEFGAKNPKGVVNGEIRRHCLGLDFPTSSPVKHFKIVDNKNKKYKFAINDSVNNTYNLNSTKSIKESKDSLPEEKIENAINEHLRQLKQEVLDLILEMHPNFFEKLVMDLLLHMGYGYDKTSGVLTGQPHDGGIDGIIFEDKLGLDLIYIQAKRYNYKNSVGRKEIQAFSGAMEKADKGVFITTSKFTNEAKEYASRQSKRIKLIDGELLSDLIIKYRVGIETVKTMSIYKVDLDYYSF